MHRLEIPPSISVRSIDDLVELFPSQRTTLTAEQHDRIEMEWVAHGFLDDLEIDNLSVSNAVVFWMFSTEKRSDLLQLWSSSVIHLASHSKSMEGWNYSFSSVPTVLVMAFGSTCTDKKRTWSSENEIEAELLEAPLSSVSYLKSNSKKISIRSGRAFCTSKFSFDIRIVTSVYILRAWTPQVSSAPMENSTKWKILVRAAIQPHIEFFFVSLPLCYTHTH